MRTTELSTYLALLSFILISLCACDNSDGRKQPAIDLDETFEQIDLTLTEGTNMAAAMSPDGTTIVADLQGTLWTMPATGGKMTPISDPDADARQPAWSPDGERICFQGYADGNWHIYAIRPDGDGLDQLTTGTSDHREPHWSPDATHIAFSSDRSGTYDIWTIDVATREFAQITNDPEEEYGPAWSPNGNHIAFIKKNIDQTFSIIIGDAQHQSTQEAYKWESQLFAPTWHSPDTIMFNELSPQSSVLHMLVLADDNVQHIATQDNDVFPFRTSRVGANNILYTGSGKLWSVDLVSHNRKAIPFSAEVELQRPLYTPKTRNFDFKGPQRAKGIHDPVISPDGESVAFIALGDVWISNKTGMPKRVTNDPYIQLAPSWSNVGDRLAYASDLHDTSGIWIYDMGAESHHRLCATPGLTTGMDWRKGDAEIAYTINFGPRIGLLWRVALENGQPARIGQNMPYSVSSPSWSGDGSSVAFTLMQPYSNLYREGINRIMRTGLDGKMLPMEMDPARSFGARGNDGPDYSPEGSQLAYISEGALWTAATAPDGHITGQPVQRTGHPMQQVDERTEESVDTQHTVSFPADIPSWSADGKQILFVTGDKLRLFDVNSGQTTTWPLELTWEPKQHPGNVVIKGGQLWDGLSDKLVANGTLTVEKNRIKAIDLNDSSGRSQPSHSANQSGREPSSTATGSDRVIDATGKFIIPGLIDIHAHQGSDAGASMGRKWLAWGVTSTRDPATNPYDALNRREAQRAGTLLSPRVFFTGSPIDGNRIYYGGSYAFQSTAHMAQELARAAALDYDMIKTYVRLDDRSQREIIAAAHALGIPVSSHELYPATKYGIDAVEHILGTSRRGYSPKMTRTYHAYSDVTDLIAKSGMSFTPTIAIYVGYDWYMFNNPDDMQDIRLQTLESARIISGANARIEKVKTDESTARTFFKAACGMITSVHNKGGLVVAGTDSPIMPFGYGLHVEMGCYEMCGIEAVDVLRMATSNAAKAMGVDKDLGILAPGKLADMLILNSNPLEDVRNLRDIEYVILNGHVYSMQDILN